MKCGIVLAFTHWLTIHNRWTYFGSSLSLSVVFTNLANQLQEFLPVPVRCRVPALNRDKLHIRFGQHINAGHCTWVMSWKRWSRWSDVQREAAAAKMPWTFSTWWAERPIMRLWLDHHAHYNMLPELDSCQPASPIWWWAPPLTVWAQGTQQWTWASQCTATGVGYLQRQSEHARADYEAWLHGVACCVCVLTLVCSQFVVFLPSWREG